MLIYGGTTLSPMAIPWQHFSHSDAVYSLNAVEQAIPDLFNAIPIPIPEPQVTIALSSGLIARAIFSAKSG